MERVSSGVLIGREDELTALTEAVASAAEGRPSALVISGEAGIGKTRLLREVGERARLGGAEILAGSCIPLSEGSLPYAPMITALRQGVTRLLDPLPASLSSGSRSDLAPLLPELSSPGPAPAAGDQTRLFGAVLDLVRALASAAPVVFVIEDVHWSDAATRDLLTYLLNMADEDRVLFLCSLRTGELESSHPVARWVQTLVTSRMAEVVEVKPLSFDESQQQMDEITGRRVDDPVAVEIYEHSEGNPFFVEELIQAWAADTKDLPPSLRELFLQRVAAVPEDAIEIVKAASVGGPTVPHDLLVAATGMDDRSFTPLLQSTIAHHLLVRTGDDGYAFRHALWREAVYKRLLPGERRSFHRSFAEAVERQKVGSPGASARSGRLARHWHEAGDPERALPHALVAATEAENSYASTEALSYYEQVLKLWGEVPDPEQLTATTRDSLLERAAGMAHKAGRPERSRELLKEAIGLVDPEAHPAHAAQLRSSLAWFEGATLLNDAAAIPLLQEARELVKDLPPSIEKAQVLCHAAGSLTLTGRFREGLEMAKQGMEIADEVGDPRQRSNALASLALAYQTNGDPERAITHHLLSVELARQQRDTRVMGRALLNLSDALFCANRPEEAAKCALDSIDELHRLGDESQSAILRCNVGEFLVALGRWDEAEEVIGPLESAPTAHDRGFAISQFAQIDVGRGRFEQARTRLRNARRLFVNLSRPQFLDPVMMVDISLALWERDLDYASDLVQGAWSVPRDERASARLCALGVRVEADRAVRARASRATDAEEQALRLGSEIEARCPIQTTRSAEVKALQLTVSAEASRLRGRFDPGGWRDAVEAWEDVSFLPQHAYALYRYGESHLSAGDRDAARDALSGARREAKDLGAAPLSLEIEGLARRARLKLSVAPEPSREASHPSTPYGDLGVTDRELEVLRRLSEGLTNKRIAEVLFISPKTASIHVSSILSKLGVSSRTEAARVAYDSGLLDHPEGP